MKGAAGQEPLVTWRQRAIAALSSVAVLLWVYVSVATVGLFARSDCRPWPYVPLSAAVAGCLGVRPRTAEYAGGVALESGLDAPVALTFWSSQTPRTELGSAVLAPGAAFVFDPGRSLEFDFLLVVRLAAAAVAEAEAVSTVVRGSSYRLVPPLAIQERSPPARRRSERLAEAPPGLSFSFSASGWLFVYQLGVAECLQNHGITRNPHVRLAGASGGALTAWTMMYGCDMRALRDLMKRSASHVHKDYSQALNVRSFLLEAMRTVLRDCSFRHPVLRTGRVEVAVSEVAGPGLLGRWRGRRIRRFSESAEVAIALLGSATLGISGLPFAWTSSDGSPGLVADGAFTDFQPEVDALSVKVKPFSDGLNILGRSPADVAPTEFVAGSYGFWPPDDATIDHLYELGYRDMEAWLDAHLAEREAQVAAAAPSEPPPPPTGTTAAPESFECSDADGGTEWYEKVRSVVPVDWREQLFSGPAGR